LSAPVVLAQLWAFESPVTVSAPADKVFHHLESSGRRSIGVAGDTVAVVWEDNRTGRPAVYLARKPLSAAAYEPAQEVSTGEDEAYEPTVIAFDDKRFVVGWEERGNVWLRIVGPASMGLPGKLGRGKSAQISLATGRPDEVFAVWSEDDRGRGRIRAAVVRLTPAGVPVIRRRAWVERSAAAGAQQYPVAAFSAGRRQYCVGWEDRRRGHTVLMAAQGTDPERFSAPRRVNELPPKDPNVKFGKGSGLARPALAGYGVKSFAAVWADKRNFVMGYDIYAALDTGSGFGTNMLVQDGFAEQIEQWRPTIAGSASGMLTAAFDDNREGNPDVWLAWLDGAKWSENLAVPGASGPGEQSHASLTLDAGNNLHLAFLESDRPGGATQVKYVFGRYKDAAR
jgi:hypothetical protein